MNLDRNKKFYVILDNIRSLENVGSIFRTSDAFGVDKIILCGISGITRQGTRTVLHPKISKTALGAEQRVEWEYFSDPLRAIKKLKSKNVFVVALETHKSAIDIGEFKPRFPLALVLGNEVAGVSSAVLKQCNKVVKIPMWGSKESFNVAVAFGIAGFVINSIRLGKE